MFWIQACNKYHEANGKVICVLISTRQLKYFKCNNIKNPVSKGLMIMPNNYQICAQASHFPYMSRHETRIFRTLTDRDRHFTFPDSWREYSPHSHCFLVLRFLYWACLGENKGSLELNIYFSLFFLRSVISTTVRLQPEGHFFKLLTTQETFVKVS